ncbi:hypothetical protein BDC45DRAFT_607198 [Circinella umbellata]|nr:hypothetical protein BDC45DRAFT_607198 [Circinella umbellata]
MHFLKRGIDAVTSATTSTRARLSQLETRATTVHNDLGKQLVIANEMIKIAPTSPKGYLLAGRTYLKQSNLKNALAVYRRGLDCVPTIISSYSLLERNYDVVYTELTNQQQQQQQQQQQPQPLQSNAAASTELMSDKVVSTFAYDIISLIFGHLSLIDLIKCTTVCESWCRFIIKWPPFWQLIEAYLPQLDTELFKLYLSSTTKYGVKFFGQKEKQPLLEKFPSSIAFSILEALHEYHHPLQTLVIENMTINTNPASFLNYLQFHSSLKSIELNNVMLPTTLSIGHLVLVCYQMERLVFKHVPLLTNDSNIDISSSISNSINELKHMATNNMSLKITYLEISLGGCPSTESFTHSNNNQLINEIIRQCSNLRQLFLDPRDSICHGQLMSTVNESCLLLEDFVINHECRMPDTAITINKIGKRSYRNGLRRLVIAGNNNNNNNMTSDQVFSFIKNHQSTIELLYLNYDGYIVTSQLLLQLAQQHDSNKKDEIFYPQLRELLIYIHQPVIMTATSTSLFSDSLSAFLLCCRPLQALSIINQINTTATFKGPWVTDTILHSLALRSSQLRYLRLNCSHSLTTTALQRIALAANDHSHHKKSNIDNNGDSSIETTLDLNFIHPDLVMVTNYWKTLKNIIIRQRSDNNNKRLSQSDQSTYNLLETNLHHRGETISIKYY